MALLRMRVLVALSCSIVMLSCTPKVVQAADPNATSAGNLFFVITNLNVPIIQDGKAKGTLLFNFLVEFTDINDRALMSKYEPKIKARFFDELYKIAATLKVDEKVHLGRIKAMLTLVVKEIVGEKKIKSVLVKDYRRDYVR